jgi:hypothetical protein
VNLRGRITRGITASLPLLAIGGCGLIAQSTSPSWHCDPTTTAASRNEIESPSRQAGGLHDGTLGPPIDCAGESDPPQHLVSSESQRLWHSLNNEEHIVLQANVWKCTTPTPRCAWATAGKTFKDDRYFGVSWIDNKTVITSDSDLTVNLTGGTPGKISGSAQSKTITWRNENTWISELSGEVQAASSSAWIRICADTFAFTKRYGVKGNVIVCAGG